jgi:hypothetical protein
MAQIPQMERDRVELNIVIVRPGGHRALLLAKIQTHNLSNLCDLWFLSLWNLLLATRRHHHLLEEERERRDRLKINTGTFHQTPEDRHLVDRSK